MPNWCDNTLNVTGSNDKVREFYKRVVQNENDEEIVSFESLMPCPDPNDWYNWRINNWGTKWNGQLYDSEMEGNDLVISFSTAWSPPEKWLMYVAENLYPELHFCLTYMETGCFFCGILEGQGQDFSQDIAEPITTDEEGKEVCYDGDTHRYKYIDSGAIIDDEDFIPIYVNIFETNIKI